MNKALLIVLVLLSVFLVYVFLMVYRANQSIGKIEAYQNAPDPPIILTTTSSTDNLVGTSILPTVVQQPVATTVLTQQPTTVVQPVVDPPPITTAVVHPTVTPTTVIVPETTVQQPATTTVVIPETIQATVQPKHVIATTSQPALETMSTVPVYKQPNPSLPVVDDEERKFWIGNVLYNMLPNNGMAKFMNEVRSLSDRLRYNTFGSILQTLRDYVADRSRRQDVALTELIDFTRQLKTQQQYAPHQYAPHQYVSPSYQHLYAPPQQPWSMFYQNSIYPNFLESQAYNPHNGVNQYQMVDGVLNGRNDFNNPHQAWAGSYANRWGFNNNRSVPMLPFDNTLQPQVEMFTNGGGSSLPRNYQREYQMNNHWARNGVESLI
jgi:hypothetical protein